jgi:uncharacterized protein (TIGR00369 family)
MDVTPAQLDAWVVSVFPSALDSGHGCESLGDGEATVRWRHDDGLLRPGGYISGPIQFQAADLALWYAVFTVIGIEPMAVTTDLHLTFLRPAVGGDLLATARILRTGRTRVHGTVDLWVDGAPDRLVSHATGAYHRPR